MVHFCINNTDRQTKKIEKKIILLQATLFIINIIVIYQTINDNSFFFFNI